VETPLLELLRCPFCHVSLESAAGGLRCRTCGRSFPIEDGIPLMLHEDLPGARAKLGETAGWVEKARAEGWYEPDDAVDDDAVDDDAAPDEEPAPADDTVEEWVASGARGTGRAAAPPADAEK